MILYQLIRVYRRACRKRSLGLVLALGLVAFSILGNAISFHWIEGRTNGYDFTDALWYSVISITTIGYGDISAETTAGRLATLFFIVGVGLATFSVVLGMGIDWVTEQTSKGIRGLGVADATNHIIIVNFPAETRVRQIIGELRSDPDFRNKPIVIVSEHLEQLPFQEEDITYIRGPILEEATYERAAASEANMAIVLATSYSESSSDAVVASAVSVLDRMKAEIHIVAECLNPNHRMLFDSVHCDAVIYSMQISGNLLAQEVHDPGVAQLVDTITSNRRGTTLFSATVSKVIANNYQEIVKHLLDHDCNVICVNRGEETMTSFRGVQPEAGDRLIYAAQRRITWDDICRRIPSA